MIFLVIHFGVPPTLPEIGNALFHLIEVKSGSYLSEDDIVRFQDNYGRA